jgi:sulfur-oxidizing protein SoxY
MDVDEHRGGPGNRAAAPPEARRRRAAGAVLTGTTRRGVLLGTGAALVAARVPVAIARPRDVEYAIRASIGEAQTRPGRISLVMPSHSDTGTSVSMALSVDCAMTEADYPKGVYVFADGNPRPRVLAVHFTPASGKAEISTRIRLEGAQNITAVAAMSDGSHWRVDRPISVSFGACADVGEGPGSPRYLNPNIRVAVPPSASRGEVVSVRTVIEHPMETGLRLNDRNQFVALRIIETFSCRYNGATVLRAVLEPAIATNPYLAFSLAAQQSGTVEFEWLDTTGDVYAEKAPINVT